MFLLFKKSYPPQRTKHLEIRVKLNYTFNKEIHLIKFNKGRSLTTKTILF